MQLKSVTALKSAVLFCMALVIALAVGAPWIIQWYGNSRNITPEGKTAIMVSYYICAVPAVIALFAMLRLLRQIGHMRPFDRANAVYLSVVSWCCLTVASVCAIGGLWYQPLYMVCAAMVFLFLTVRVVYSCFKAAALLQEDSDLTI